MVFTKKALMRYARLFMITEDKYIWMVLTWMHRFVFIHIFAFYVNIFDHSFVVVVIYNHFGLQFNSWVIFKILVICFVFTGGTYKPRKDWSRCLPSESPQNILHPSWRRWPWHGSYWSKETLGTIFTFTSSGNNFCSMWHYISYHRKNHV